MTAAWLGVAMARVVVNTGQLTKDDRRTLDAAVRRGEIARWRGYWYPVAGAAFGLGPLKTCYGPVDCMPGGTDN